MVILLSYQYLLRACFVKPDSGQGFNKHFIKSSQSWIIYVQYIGSINRIVNWVIKFD